MQRRDDREGAFASGGSHPASAGDLSKARYTIKDVTSLLGISRTTLLWYEKVGIVHPDRDPKTKWRIYSDADILGLLGATTLKNSGMPFHEQSADSEEYAFTLDKINGYIDFSRRQEEYSRARTECLVSIREVVLNHGQIGVDYLEAFYFFPYAELGASGGTLARHLPITALSSLCVTGWGENAELRRGWSVPIRFAHLVELPAVAPQVFGDQTCLFLLVSFESTLALDQDGAWMLARMDDYMAEHGLVACGKLFIPRVIPFDKGGCAALCLPVEPAAV